MYESVFVSFRPIYLSLLSICLFERIQRCRAVKRDFLQMACKCRPIYRPNYIIALNFYPASSG